jgi:type 1 glutamine amidotransferase
MLRDFAIIKEHPSLPGDLAFRLWIHNRKGTGMLKRFAWTTLAGALVLTAFHTEPVRAGENRATKIKVLIIDGQNNHNWKATTPFMKKQLEDSGRFVVDVATSPPRVNMPKKPKDNDRAAEAKYKEELAKYTAYRQGMDRFRPPIEQYGVILSNYNGDRWSRELQEALEACVKSGKVGLVIVHAANNSFSGWGEYDRMIGMGWRGPSYGERLTLDKAGKEVLVPKGKGPGAGHGKGHAFQVTVRDPAHPVTKGMPHEWMHASDELYHGMRGPVEKVHLLATAFSDKSTGGTGEHEPMIWTVTYGMGRVFHTPMGHDLNGMRCIGFLTTLRRGTEWAATGAVTIPIPPNFPTATKVSQVPAQ